MGLFDTVWITCPVCRAHVDMQVKPPLVEGKMQEWDLEDAPWKVLYRIRNWEEECDCGFRLRIEPDLTDPTSVGISLVATKRFPIASPQTQPPQSS